MAGLRKQSMESLLKEVRACRICEKHLPLGPRPVLQAATGASILIAGQAPGTRVHNTGIPFNDPSGDRLRDWMGVSRELFYDPSVFAIIPMGFCYPGKGKSGDLPPRPECAPAWREKLLSKLPNIQLTIVLGTYAQAYHLGEPDMTVTEAAQNWKRWWPRMLALPHPSPRNNIWLKRNPWFEKDVLPVLRRRVKKVLKVKGH